MFYALLFSLKVEDYTAVYHFFAKVRTSSHVGVSFDRVIVQL